MKKLYNQAEDTAVKGLIAFDTIFGIAALAGLREEREQAQLFVDTGATLPDVFKDRYSSLVAADTSATVESTVPSGK